MYHTTRRAAHLQTNHSGHVYPAERPMNVSTAPQSSRCLPERVGDGAEGENVIDRSNQTGHCDEGLRCSTDKVSQSQILAALICLYYHVFPHLLRLLAHSSLTPENYCERNSLALVRYKDTTCTEDVDPYSACALSKALVPRESNSLVRQEHNQLIEQPPNKQQRMSSQNDSSRQQGGKSYHNGGLDSMYQKYTEWEGENKGNFYGVTYNNGGAPAFQGNITGGTQQGPGKSQTYGATEISGNALHFMGDVPLELALELLKQQNQQAQAQQAQPAGQRLGSAPSNVHTLQSMSQKNR